MTRFRGGYPIIRHVAKTDPEGAYSLLRAIATVPPNAANDNHEDTRLSAGDDDFEPAGAAREQFFAERRHKVTPTISYIVTDLLRPRVLTEKRRDSGYAGNGRKIISRTDRVSFCGAMARLGDFIFNFDFGARRAGGGTMIQYGFTAKGKPLEPRTDVRELRGGDDNGKLSVSPRRYLSVRSTEEFRDQVLEPRTYRTQLDETPSAKEARQQLVTLGVDGGRTFESAREAAGLPPADRCRDGIAWKLDFLGGMKAPKATARNPAPDLWTRDDPAEAFGEHVRGILQEIAARTNLKALGRYLGYSEHYADRGAKRELATVIDEVKRAFPSPPRKAANENTRAECALLCRVTG